MPGNFIWYELLTSDIPAAIAFYDAVVGWKIDPQPAGDMDYRIIVAPTGLVGGLTKIPDEAAAKGMVPGWQAYIGVDNVDDTVTAILDDGGKVHMPAVTMDGVGRMAMVADPTGASFYVMTPFGEGESTAFAPGQPGKCGWNELHTTDAEAALAFYTRHFGWVKTGDIDIGPDGKYHMFNCGSGDAVGGMMKDGNFPHPAWLYYMTVGDIDAAKDRIDSGGGTILMGPHEVPGGSHVIVGIDPQGAMFALIGPRL